MSEMTHTPADVRERVAMEVYVWEHVRRGAEESWARQRWQTETDGMRDLYFEAADRILDALSILTARGEAGGDSTDCPTCGDELAVYWEDGRIRGVVSLDQPARAALLSTPRGEGEAWRAFLDALDEFEAEANLWADPEGPTAADMERLRQSRQRVIECARVLAARRGEGGGDGE